MTPGDSRASNEGPAEELGQGRYVIVGTLGAGSQGETLEAVDKREGRAVAIKRFTLRGAKSWKDVELAEREANVLAQLQHPGLPRYIEHFEEDGTLCLVMEKVEGLSLAELRRKKQPLTHEQVLRFLRDAANCLAYLHGHAPPIVHRDIKPGNVLLRPDGSYCLVDFGSVRDSLKPEGGSTVVGTFGYMAPEQFQGRAAPVSDVYAVGATALSLLSGREPEDLPHKGLAVDVDSALSGQVDRRLITALRLMLEPDPERRAPSVDVALERAGLRTPAPSGSPSAEAAKQARRGRIEAEDAARGFDRQVRDYAEQVRQRALREAELERERAYRKADRHLERDARKRAEREERKARKADRRAERHQRHAAWHGRGRPVPPGIVLGLFLLVVFRVAAVATFALFQVLLPLFFTLMGNGRARQRMLEIGHAGQRGLGRASGHIRYAFLGGPTPSELDSSPPARPPRADEGPPAASTSRPPRQRVSAEAVVDTPTDEADAAAQDVELPLEDFEARARKR